MKPLNAPTYFARYEYAWNERCGNLSGVEKNRSELWRAHLLGYWTPEEEDQLREEALSNLFEAFRCKAIERSRGATMKQIRSANTRTDTQIKPD